MNNIAEKLTFRLPNGIRPSLYSLLINPDLKMKTFKGNVKIDITVFDKSPFIALHSKFLNVTAAKLMKQLQNGLEGIALKRTFEYEKFEYFVVEPEVTLDVGNYTLDLDFNGSLQDKIVGLYSSSYPIKNQTRYILWES